ncbi:sacsin N-terminal ATP-binding-like domain-containing protein [Planotetraspora sp. GP83]|uniref:sacsin N-terminal ATP-binding-like domain-containing protein n=1 Tax=Planotetraspora sp. GP83 TaxID=3156264 RepID=UPI00351420B4
MDSDLRPEERARQGSHDQELRSYALTILQEWQETKTWRIAEQLKAATWANARDYRGRSLLELLQNAHDAHAGDRHEGRVHIVLDETEGEYGTLYVANGGTPFTWERVMAICKFAMSEKTVGDGIGNKGVGFRSVLELTTAPEIFSAQPGESAERPLSGYRFRFATPDDLLNLLGDEQLAAKAAAEMPPFQVPFPISYLPEECAALAVDGYVTVIRLPLKSQNALDDATRLWTELATADVPVLLFLNRLERLALERRTDSDESQHVVLTRQERAADIAGLGPECGGEHLPTVTFAEVDLGALGQFLVARGRIPDTKLRETVDLAVSLGDLDESWQDWTEPAVIEIALPLQEDSRAQWEGQGRIYTFLPLGDDVRAPLRGHLNAPFFTKVDRTALDRQHQLNAMLLNATAETCLVAADRLKRGADAQFRRTAVDLVNWDPTEDSVRLLSEAARRVHNREFRHIALVPVLGKEPPGFFWDTPASAVLWPRRDTKVLTIEAARRAGIRVADPGVGTARLDRLNRLCGLFGASLTPTDEDLADQVERMVAALQPPRDHEPLELWNDLYIDIFRLFERRRVEVLRGRRLLLADDGRLRHFNGQHQSEADSSGRRHEAFFQPTPAAQAGLNGIHIPRALRKRLFYVHQGLRWSNELGQPNRQDAHAFLVRLGLVRQFDIQELLQHVRDALRESSSQDLHRQSLKFVFQLYRSRQGTSLPVKDLGLHVPTRSGTLLSAADAVFGAGWRDTNGDDLAAVVEEGRDASSDLKALEVRFVASSEEFTRQGGTQEEWRVFLSALGVTDGLIPISSADASTYIYAPGGRAVVQGANTPDDVRRQWEPEVLRLGMYARRPQSYYAGGHAYRLPGQGVVSQLSDQGRLAYARLVLDGLAKWTNDHFISKWVSRTTRDHDTWEIPTPLSAFLRTEPWLPVRKSDRTVGFARPADVWHVPLDNEDDLIPLRRVHLKMRNFLKNSAIQNRLRAVGMPTWGNPEDSVRSLVALGELVATGTVGVHDRGSVERANRECWERLADRSRLYGFSEIELQPLLESLILIERDEALDVIRLSDLLEGEGVLYVSDERDNLTVRFIREMENALLIVPGRARRVAYLLTRLCSGQIKHVDAAALAVEIDGQAPIYGELGDPLHALLPWLPNVIGVLADHHQRTIRPTEGELADLVASFRAIRLHGYASLNIRLDGAPVQLPARQCGVLPLPDDDVPVIAAPRSLANELNWESLEKLSDAISHVLGRPDFAVRLQLAARRLRDSYADPADPAKEELAAALDVSLSQYEETSRRLDGSLAEILVRLYPVFVHTLGMDEARELTDPRPSDANQLQVLLAEHEARLPFASDQLIRTARTVRTVDELREVLEIDFAEFNRTLLELAPRYQPISRADVHEDAMRRRVGQRRTAIIDRLRRAFLSKFDSRDPINGWTELRSLQWITVPDSWALTVDNVTNEYLDAHIGSALAARLGIVSEPEQRVELPDLDRVRIDNLTLVQATIPELRTLIRAAGRFLPAALEGDVADLLDQCGVLDFRPLGKDDVVAWLAVLGHWPSGMPLTTAAEAHGITRESLAAQQSAAARAREEQLRRRRIILLGEREFDAGSGDFTDLADELRRRLSENPRITVRNNRFAPLEPVAPRQRSVSPIGQGGSLGGGRRDELSLEQRMAIGFAGELIAYEWLRANYPATTEESWVSTNRRKAFPGSTGDDTLGYDFKVGTGNHARMFEVKATQADGGQVELGESEARAAQRYAGSNRWSVLAVTWVLTPERTVVHRMPNPFSTAGRGLYRMEGGSLRFSYRLDS